MKITHVITDSNIGGAGILLGHITSSLSKDFDTEVILPRGSRLISRLSFNGKITEFDMTPDKSFSPRELYKFYSYFKATRPDIVHTHAALTARLSAKISGVKKCISTRHCAIANEAVKRQSPPAKALYNYCTDITVSSANFATGNLIFSGIDPGTIKTIKNGSPPAKKLSSQSISELRARLSIPKDAFVFGSCARLEDVKGQDLILRATAALIAEDYPICLIIIGCGSCESKLKQLAAKLGIFSQTRFLGYVPDPSPYQNLFYVNISASRGTETSCLANSECMSLGIPSVVSNFGGNTEQITHLENGLVFPSGNAFALGNALRRIITDKRLYERLSERAEKRYHEEFSLAKMIDSYRELYYSLK